MFPFSLSQGATRIARVFSLLNVPTTLFHLCVSISCEALSYGLVKVTALELLIAVP